MQLTLRARGPLAADVAWERYADPARWPTWAPQIKRVDADGRLRPGMRGRVHSYAPPPVAFEVLDVDEAARTWSWIARVGPLALRLDHGVADAVAGGSGAWLRITGPAPVVLGYAPLAQVALSRLVR